MRLTYTDIYQQFLRNIQSVGATTDTNLTANFNYQLGVYYQLMLAKLKNYKTAINTTFKTGMTVTKSGVGQAISTITYVGTTATVTTTAAHGYSNSDSVIISNCNPSVYNGTYTITVTSTTTFTYTVSSTPTANASHAQYFANPPGYITADGIVLTVGSINYPLKLISSEYVWEQLNAVLLIASALPQFFYPRRDDFGIWPIPQAIYTGKIYYHYRDRNLMVADYTGGSITVTSGSTEVVGAGTTFTAAMVGRWLFITDTTVPGQGYEYRIDRFVDTTHVILSQPFVGTTTAGITGYKIGECPEIPEDLHMYLVDGVTGGYYKDIRKDAVNGQLFLNSFWTGDMNNPSRKEGDQNVMGGLIGAMKAYADREDERIVNREEKLNPLSWKPWSHHGKIRKHSSFVQESAKRPQSISHRPLLKSQFFIGQSCLSP